MQNNESNHAHPPTAVHPSSSQRIAIAVVITALIFGVGGYLFGQRTVQTPSQAHRKISLQPSRIPNMRTFTLPTPISFDPKKFYPLPTTDPVLTADWKTYTNEKYGFTLRYPSSLYAYDAPTAYAGFQKTEEETWFEPSPIPSPIRIPTLFNRKRVLLMTEDYTKEGKGPLLVVYVKNKKEMPSDIFDSTKYKEDSIELGGKPGIISGFPIEVDGKRYQYIDIIIPFKEKYLVIEYNEKALPIDEFAQMLSAFKFTQD